MKFPKQDLIDIFRDDYDDTVYEVVEEGDWISGGKYEYAEYIFKFDDKFYSIEFSRTGSYYSDYEYTFEYCWDEEVDCPEVEQVEVVKLEWRPKK